MTVNRTTIVVEIHAAANETLANKIHEIVTKGVDASHGHETMTGV